MFLCQKCGKTLEEADIVWVKRGKGLIYTVPDLLRGKMDAILPKHMKFDCWGNVITKPEKGEG